MLREGILFATHDGCELSGDLYLPNEPGPHPALVAVPGGAWLRGDRKGLQRWGEYLSARGIAVFSIDYRRSVDGPIFPQNACDVLAAVRFAHAKASDLGIDPRRLGLLGASAGAHLAALVALAGDTPLLKQRYPDDVGAGDLPALAVLVTVYGVFDLHAHWTADSGKTPGPEGDFTQRMLGAAPPENSDLYRAASPTSYVSKASRLPPTLVIWGDRDTDVLSEQSARFARALSEAGHKTETVVVEGAGHFWFSRDAIEDPFNALVAPRLTDFLTRALVRA